jgi:hypothetical protein
MPATKRPIFREVAIQHYMQSRTRDILPRYISPPVFLLLWIFCGLCFSSLCLAWNVRVPTYISGVGAVISAQSTSSKQNNQMIVVFLAADQHANVRPGAPIQLQFSSAVNGLGGQTVTEVEPTVLSPSEIRKTYLHDERLSLLITQPSVVVIVALKQQSAFHLYEGSIVQAQIQVGSQSLLSMIPGINTVIGA